jgi:SOS-response transcriptional repressor LexA
MLIESFGKIPYMEETTGARILRMRKALGLSQDDVANAVGVSRVAISNWENNQIDNMKAGNLFKLAAALKTSAMYILSGIEDRLSAPSADQHVPAILDRPNVDPIPSYIEQGKVPLISWVTAGSMCELVDMFQPGYAEDYLPCPVPHGPHTFALRVRGLSMYATDGSGYKDGDLIYIDPDVTPRHDDDVVVRTPNSQTTFKRLQKSPEGDFLLALNPDWPERIIRVPEGTVICGVCIASMTNRRR